MGVLLGFADLRRALLGVLLLGGCLPRGDLAGYSESHVQPQPGAVQVAVPALTPAPDQDPEGASNEDGPGVGPSEGETAPSLVNLVSPDAPNIGTNTSSTDLAADAGSTTDGGSPALSATESDAGTVVSSTGTVVAAPASDAGSGADEACASAGGTLEPGTRSCVFIAAEQLSWPAAVAACAAQGRQLISIQSPDLDSFLTPLMSDDVWIGARDPVMLNPASNAFVWLDGTPVSSTNWALGEPDAQLNQYCVSKTSAAPTGPWRDRPCGELKAYICEQTL